MRTTALLLACALLLAVTMNSFGLQSGSDSIYSIFHVNPLRTSNVEDQMADLSPAAITIFEAEQYIESWMATPFNFDERVEMESWMVTPFNLDEQVVVESWMVTPFPYEDELGMESWMSVPFMVDEEVVLESWMSASW